MSRCRVGAADRQWLSGASGSPAQSESPGARWRSPPRALAAPTLRPFQRLERARSRSQISVSPRKGSPAFHLKPDTGTEVHVPSADVVLLDVIPRGVKRKWGNLVKHIDGPKRDVGARERRNSSSKRLTHLIACIAIKNPRVANLVGIWNGRLIVQIPPDVSTSDTRGYRPAFPRQRRGTLPTGRPADAVNGRLVDAVDNRRIGRQGGPPPVDVGNRNRRRKLTQASIDCVARIRIKPIDMYIAEIVVRVVQLRDHAQKPHLYVLRRGRRTDNGAWEQVREINQHLELGEPNVSRNLEVIPGKRSS